MLLKQWKKTMGHLKISMYSTEEEHVVEITDNGSGISEENMQRLFEPYFTSKRNGMGLGSWLNFKHHSIAQCTY